MIKDQVTTRNSSFLSVKTLSICVALIVLAFVAAVVLKVSISTLLFAGALLACPLMHVWMMKEGGHKH